MRRYSWNEKALMFVATVIHPRMREKWLVLEQVTAPLLG